MAAILGLLISLTLGAVVLHIAVKLVAGDRTGNQGFGTAMVANLVMIIAAAVLNHVPLLGLLLSLAAWFVVVMQFYRLGFGRALLVWLVYLFIVGGVLAVLSMFFGAALFGLLGLAAIFA